ncbi:hypothetical protein BJ085DRAFT_35350 [Dimargaris cristalligena]|uniref:DUF2421 domain-containing protein n=1 Tax=Dimargaris cristalligena TaxID=215637 RepID=A0A4P9ZM05_9FUNG|nr:hypothetical protein BJ085DRAFT_35350 [Dimargaris cristalligena]|eukprot:RKP33260.1 hypothetical protein BJ085DRAFT_35350 [Dimargaris cristalligena]
MTTGNRYGLFIVTLVFSIPAFYVAIFTPHKSVGHLSANVFTVTVYALYTRNHGGDTILTLAYKRLWNTLAGILVALVINAWLWPRIARVELRHFTALGLDTLGNIFSRLVAQLVIHPLLNPQNHFFKLYLEHVRWQEAQQELSMLGGTSRRSSSALSLPPKWTEKVGQQVGPVPYSLLGASRIDINDVGGNTAHNSSGGVTLTPGGLIQRLSRNSDPHTKAASRLSRILTLPHVASLLPTNTSRSIASRQSQSLSVDGLRTHPPGRFGAISNMHSNEHLGGHGPSRRTTPTSLTPGERIATLDIDYPYTDFPPPRAVLRPHRRLNASIVKASRKMQDLLGRSQAMLQESALEPRLQGPFPKAVYAEILDRFQNIMDRFISMSITAAYISPQVHNTVITPFNQHGRRDMAAAILINFYALAGALRSKTPLPPYLPSGRAARTRLIQQIKSHLAHARPFLDKSSTYEFPSDDSDSTSEDSDLEPNGQQKGEPGSASLSEQVVPGNQVDPAPQLDQEKRAGRYPNLTTEPLDQVPPSQARYRHRRSTLASSDIQHLEIHHNPHREYIQYEPTQHSHSVPPDQVGGAGKPRSPLASSDDGDISEDEDEWLSMPPRQILRTFNQKAITHHYPGDDGGGEEQSFEASTHASHGPLGGGPEPSQHYPPPPKEAPPALGKPPGGSQRPPRKYMLSTFYWYAHSAAMEEVIEELENIVILVKSVVGENDVLHELLDSPGW